jgi:hypothetical protein
MDHRSQADLSKATVRVQMVPLRAMENTALLVDSLF